MAQLFAPNERDARRIGKVVKRVEKMVEDSSKSARIGGTTSDDVYLVKILSSIGAAFELKWRGVEVTYNMSTFSYDVLEEGIRWEDPLDLTIKNNAGYIRSTSEFNPLQPSIYNNVFEALLVYNTDGDPEWVFVLQVANLFTSTDGSNVGDGTLGNGIRFSNDIFDSFGYSEPTDCAYRGVGDCSNFIEPQDRVYLVLEDAYSGPGGPHVRMWAKIEDLLSIFVKESIEIDVVDGKAHFVNDELDPASCGYYGIDDTGVNAGKGWFAFDDLKQNSVDFDIVTCKFEFVNDELDPAACGYYGIDNTGLNAGKGWFTFANLRQNSIHFDIATCKFELVNDEVSPADCSFYGKITGALGWHLFSDMVQKSITLDPATCKFELVNDVLAPGDKYYYGTAGGVKGFHVLGDPGAVLSAKSITGDGLLGTELQLVNDAAVVPIWSIYGTSSGVGPAGLGWRGLDVFAKDSIEFNTAGAGGFHLINDSNAPADGTLYAAFSGSGEVDHRGWHDISAFLKDVASFDTNTRQLIWHSVAGDAFWTDVSLIIQDSLTMDSTFDTIKLVNDQAAPADGKLYAAFSGSGDVDHRGWHTISAFLKDVTSYVSGTPQLIWHNAAGEAIWTDVSGIVQDSVVMDATSKKIKLDGDEASPVAWKFYGTEGTPTRGYQQAATITVVTGVQLDGSNNLQIKTTQIRAFDLQTESAWTTVTGWTKAPCP